MLKANGKYKNSNEQMAKFAAMRPADQGRTFLENPNYLPEILQKEKNIIYKMRVSILDILILEAPLTSKLYFASARNDRGKNYGWNQEPFLDIYAAVQNMDGSFQTPLPLETINTKYHEGLVSFSADGKTMYFQEKVTLTKSLKETLYREISTAF